MDTFIVDGSSQVFQAENEEHAVEQFLSSIGVFKHIRTEQIQRITKSVIDSGFITVWQSDGEEW
jgi:ribosomal protein L20A (L18A)